MDNDFLLIEKVSKIFETGQDVRVVGLVELSLSIGRGEFVVVSGPSGSGKTTLLNIVGGLDDATKGRVVLDGLEITGLRERKLAALRRDHIGFIFQAYNLIPVLTARENISYVMQLQNRAKGEIEERVEEIASKLGIQELLDKLPNQMSGGQQQRVAVARAVASKPQLILADEPTANLDSKTASSLMDMMQKLNEEEGITIIFSSHDPLVISKAKHSIVLRDGVVVENVFP
ncbi:MAG: ABC transporter ATP-binding protein [Desulfobulbaceae bacterium]|nr:ABC transporter ATP-binding protein [Desulfobulbaceae bacterium]